MSDLSDAERHVLEHSLGIARSKKPYREAVTALKPGWAESAGKSAGEAEKHGIATSVRPKTWKMGTRQQQADRVSRGTQTSKRTTARKAAERNVDQVLGTGEEDE